MSAQGARAAPAAVVIARERVQRDKVDLVVHKVQRLGRGANSCRDAAGCSRTSATQHLLL
jgi:hypothetical protein